MTTPEDMTDYGDELRRLAAEEEARHKDYGPLVRELRDRGEGDEVTSVAEPNESRASFVDYGSQLRASVAAEGAEAENVDVEGSVP